MEKQNEKAVLLVSARDAAKMLAVSPRKLWAMTFEETPGLPYVRCGRLVRYSPDDLRRWIKVHRLQAMVEREGCPIQTAAELLAEQQSRQSDKGVADD